MEQLTIHIYLNHPLKLKIGRWIGQGPLVDKFEKKI